MRIKLAVVVASSLFAACGGGGGSGGGDDTVIVDSGNASCTAAANYASPTLDMAFASRDMATAPKNVYGGGYINADTAPDAIFLNLFKGFGTFTTGEITAKSVTISGDEIEGASCGACLEIDTDVDTMAGTQKDTYLAKSGTINITAVSPMLTFTVSNAQFRHVDITDADTFTTQDSADGCQSAISSLSFTATVEDDTSGSGSAARIDNGSRANAQRYRLSLVH